MHKQKKINEKHSGDNNQERVFNEEVHLLTFLAANHFEYQLFRQYRSINISLLSPMFVVPPPPTIIFSSNENLLEELFPLDQRFLDEHLLFDKNRQLN